MEKDLCEGIQEAFSFLCERYNYEVVVSREPSLCSTEPFDVLRYTNHTAARCLEVRVQYLPDNEAHYHASFMRLTNGVRPSHKDNINYLPLSRVLAYYEQPDWVDDAFTRSEVQEKFQQYSSVLRRNDELLNAAGWFDRARMIRNEKALYVLTLDWGPAMWIDDAIERLKTLLGTTDLRITRNWNDIPSYETCGEILEVRSGGDGLTVTILGGYLASRDRGFTVTVSRGGRETRREYCEPTIQEMFDSLARDIEEMTRHR